MIAALMLVGYDYKAVDASGNPPRTFPQVDRNDIQMVRGSYDLLQLGFEITFTEQSRPTGEPCYLEFKRVV